MIYLDNAATTKPFKEHNFNLEQFFNPSSAYATEINSKIFNVKKMIASELSASAEDVIFTSGGTEANNLAILGYAKSKESKFNIAYLGFEHKSVTTSVEYLKNKNYNIINIDYQLLFNSLNEFIELLKKENITFLILSHIYSESGMLIPIEKIVKRVKKEIPNIYIHVDAVQSFLKYKINLSMGINSISISAHKIHGIKGIGALVLKNRQSISPIILGGKQNNNLRGGTENIFGIISLGLAIEIWQKNRKEFTNTLIDLKKYFDKKFIENFKDDKVIKILENNNSHIVTLGVKNLFAEHIIRYLESEKIYLSSGSACNDSKSLPKFLKYLKVKKEYHNGIIRVSFSVFNNQDEIDKLFSSLKVALEFF